MNRHPSGAVHRPEIPVAVLVTYCLGSLLPLLGIIPKRTVARRHIGQYFGTSMTSVSISAHSATRPIEDDAGYLAFAIGTTPGAVNGTCKDVERKHDTTQMPSVYTESFVNEIWACSKHGQIYQVEGVIVNQSSQFLDGMRMDIEPAGCVKHLWNLAHLKDDPSKDSFALGGYWSDKKWSGGIPPASTGTVFRWGGLFITDKFKITYKPYKPLF